MEGIYQESNYYRDLLIQSQTTKQTAPEVGDETSQDLRGLGGMPLISISFLDGNSNVNLGSQGPVLLSPLSNDTSIDLNKLLNALRSKVNDTLYQSGINQMLADQHVQAAHNSSNMDSIMNLTMSIASLNQNENAINAANSIIDEETKAVSATGLAQAQATEASLAAQASLAENQYLQAVNDATAAVNQATTNVSSAESNKLTAETNYNNAVNATADATADVNAAQQELDKLKEIPQDPENPDAAHEQELADAQQKLDDANAALKDAQGKEGIAETALKSATAALDKANADLTSAQTALDNVDRTALDKANAALAEQQQKISNETYAVDVTQVLPKTTELLSGTATFIDQIAAANPQMTLGQDFLKSLGIELQPGQSTSQALTGELSRRLEASGLSSGEADALATLVMTGNTSAINSLPKTTLDVIQKFSNDVSQACNQEIKELSDTLMQESTALSSIPPAEMQNLKNLIMSLEPSLLGADGNGETNPITAMLKLMGEAVNMIVELAEEQYKERLDLEQQIKNHI